MNTPFGKFHHQPPEARRTSDEFALAPPEIPRRPTPQTQAGKWEKEPFMGVGESPRRPRRPSSCGNIGSMWPIAPSPCRIARRRLRPVSCRSRAGDGAGRREGRARRAASLRAAYQRCIVPLNRSQTRNVLSSARRWAKTRPGVPHRQRAPAAGSSTQVAPARGARLRHVAGAAFDSSPRSRRRRTRCFGHPQRGLHAAPGRRHHGGAGERGAAGGRADVRPISSRAASRKRVVNFPSILGRGAPRPPPFGEKKSPPPPPFRSARGLGRESSARSWAQLTKEPIRGVRIEYEGAVAGHEQPARSRRPR